MKIHVGSLLGQ